MDKEKDEGIKKSKLKKRKRTNNKSIMDLPSSRKKLLVLNGNNKRKEENEKSNENPYPVEIQEFLISVEDVFNDDTGSKIKIKDAIRAVVEADGYIVRAAKKLNINYATLRKIIDKTPKLRQILEDVTNSTLDLAESKLKQHIANGNLTAILFHLKCKGRSRGWTEDQALIPVEDKPIKFIYKEVKNNAANS